MSAPQLARERRPAAAGLPLVAVEVGTTVRPGRVRNRTKTGPEEKIEAVPTACAKSRRLPAGARAGVSSTVCASSQLGRNARQIKPTLPLYRTNALESLRRG
jgi:hypothetical protein